MAVSLVKWPYPVGHAQFVTDCPALCLFFSCDRRLYGTQNHLWYIPLRILREFQHRLEGTIAKFATHNLLIPLGIGILNVQKRIKYLCGRKYGLSYEENSAGGVTARLLLPINKEEVA